MSSKKKKQGADKNQPSNPDSTKSGDATEEAASRTQNKTKRYPRYHNARANLASAKKTAAHYICLPVRWLAGLPHIDRFTFLVAVFTGILAITTGVQVWAFIQSERAFIAASAIGVVGIKLVANTNVVAILEVKNSGRSTGFIRTLNMSAKFIQAKNRLQETPDYRKNNEIAPGPVVAGGSYKIRDEVHGFKDEPHLVLNEADIALVNSGDYVFYIYGFMFYTDEFSFFGNRVTGFCACYNPNGDASTSFDSCPDKAYTYAH